MKAFKNSGFRRHWYRIDIVQMMVCPVGGDFLRKMKQASVSEAWATTTVFRPYTKVSVNKYFQEIKPLMILQRALGRIPYSFNKQGLAPFKFLSFPVLYTAVFLIFHSAWTIYTMSIVVNKKISNAPSYEVALFWVSLCLILVMNLTTPFTKWVDVHKFANFVSSWQDFQDNHLNSEVEMTLSLPIKIIAVLILPVGITLMFIECYLVIDISFLSMVPFITGFCAATATLVHWCTTLYELRAASRVLLSKITKDGCRQMSKHRRTWLKLSKLVSEVGETNAWTGMMTYVVFLASLVLGTYALLSSFFESATFYNNFWGLLVSAILGFLSNFVLCDAAHRTTQEVGPDFSTKILSLDLNHLSQDEINEFSLLLHTMSAHPPLVGYKGFVVIDRHLFVSALSNLVTYLVVLVQLKVSPPMIVINEEAGQ